MFVIFNSKTTRTFKAKYGGTRYFDTERAAKSMITRLKNAAERANASTGKNNVETPFDSYAEAAEFSNNIEKTETRKNFMTGKEFSEPVNTPYFASPSSETYWSS